MLLSNLNLLATAPGGVARLRELILTLAVQGKLVPQDPKDEPASELLKKIRVEKDRLIAEGKIKRDKPLAEIDDDEKPFLLPAGWEWERFGVIAGIERGGSPRPIESFLTDDPAGLNWIKIGDTEKGGKYITSASQKIKREGLVKTRMVFPGDFLLTNSMSFGRPYITQIEGCIHDGWLRISPPSSLNKDFLYVLLSSRFIRTVFEAAAAGGVVLNLNADKVRTVPIPLPPLAEQSRIVTRVEELMRLCDALEAKGQLEATQHAQLVSTLLATLTDSETPAQLADNWHRIATHFDLLLDRPEAVDALEQTILQLAVRGLLVPQDPQDEPASVLLKKIRIEKDKRIAVGKIKRDKPLPPIADDEQPFALPAGWCWARFPELGEFGRGKSKHRPRNDPALFNPSKYPLIQTGEVSRAKGVVKEVHSYYSDLGLAQSRMWPKGTLCITIAANIAESAVLGFDSCFPDSVVGFVPEDAMGNVDYFLLFVETARADLLAFAPATAQKNINLEILSSLLIPVPPLNELTRIVTRVAQLRRLCADLRQRLAASQSTQAHLAEALIQEVV
jgi:type I restriction enzyme S subunit